jgi:tRNA-2-methylthio-N6-dimethylallyladenosine synthase
MKFIHLPVQSGNDKILHSMNRRYDRKQYLNLVRKMKERIPNLALSTDIIVGFPNESYEEFKDTVTLCQEVEYDSAFTFIYSPRNGTPAAKIKDNVEYKEKSKRFIELTKALEVIIEEKSKKMVGQVFDVLVDSVSKKDKTMLSGYNENNKLINFRGDESLIGKIIKVKIIESHTYSLIGEIVEND